MTREEYYEMLEGERKRREEINSLFQDTLKLLREVRTDLERKEVMVSYNKSVQELYQVELPVKGSIKK